MILVKIARLVPGKRYDILFAVINKLVNEEKMDIKLLVISDGPLLNEFRVYLRDNNLEENIFLLGEVSNVIDYISVADAIPLLSEAEASNSVIKEAGLVNKCVIVCRGVGDFDDYIEDEISGLFMDKMNPFEDLEKHLTNIYESKVNKDKLGNNLHISVMNNFSIDHVINNYNTLNSIR
jgi:glycosyltransferase involved in cell wall biosynthesis